VDGLATTGRGFSQQRNAPGLARLVPIAAIGVRSFLVMIALQSC